MPVPTNLKDTITVDAPPMVNMPERTGTLTSDLTRAYATDGWTWLGSMVKALPAYTDDIERDFGLGIYDEMQKMPAVVSSLRLLCLAALKNEVTLKPASTPTDSAADNDTAQEIADFCSRSLASLDVPLSRTLHTMLHDALAYGYKVAEQVYELRTEGEDAGKLVLRSVTPKHRSATRFVTDLYGACVGLLAVAPGFVGGASQWTFDIQNPPTNLTPRSRWAVLTFEPRDGDLRGRSVLRACYRAFYSAGQLHIELMKHLARFGSPMLVGEITSPQAPGVRSDVYGAVQTTNGVPVPANPEINLTNKLVQLRNGAVMAVSNATVKAIEASGGGQIFFDALDRDDRQIVLAILGSTLATLEGEHQARAASETHMDVVTLFVEYLKALVCDMIRLDVLKPLIRYNFGSAAADRFCPLPSLGSLSEKDKTGLFTALASLYSAGYFDAPKTDQIDALDADLGLPPRADAPLIPTTPAPLPAQDSAPTPAEQEAGAVPDPQLQEAKAA